jgi:hypothetical protein
MNRRTLLSIGTAAASLGTAGCLGEVNRRLESDSTTKAEQRYPDNRNVPADAATHDLFVENFDETERVVTLTVRRASDDALVWQNVYETPDERGFVVPDLLVAGRTYELATTVDDGRRATVEQSVEPCPGEGGSRNVGVWIEDGVVTYRQDNCDEILVGVKLSYADHERFIGE